MFISKAKKLSIIAGAITSIFVLSTFSSFAVGPTEKSLGGPTIGVSSEIGTQSKQKAGANSVNEKAEPKVIKLDTPGDYRLVGAEKGISNNQDPNEIIVNINDRICIGDIKNSWDDIGDPHEKYNIILDNVNIDVNEDKWYGINAITIGKNVDVTFTLVGKNSLNCESDHCDSALSTDFKSSKLTINELDTGASLDAHGCFSGINGRNLIINGGTITATGRHGIYASNTTINCGTITAIGDEDEGIKDFSNLTINGGTITATGKYRGISSNNNIEINGGTITATGEKSSGLSSALNIEINGGKVNTNKIYLQRNLIMNGGELIIGSIHGLEKDKDIKLDHYMSRWFNELIKLDATYDKSKKMYSIYDNKGERVWIKNVGQNNNDNIIVYHLTRDIGSSVIINFYITGGIINGIIDFTPGESSKMPTDCLPFGSQFPGQGPTSELCDIEMFFNNK